MKYIKEYYDINSTSENAIKIGDYILADANFGNEYWNNIIKNNIGQILDIDDSDDFLYKIRIAGKKTILRKGEIKYWSKNKEELETILTANNYNL